MEIELENSVIEFGFQHCQIEITGKCNMRCEHCRAWDEARVHMGLDLFKKCVDFATSEAYDGFRVTISGGEPFLHPELVNMLKYLKEKRIEDIIITTNGSLVTKDKLEQIKKIGFKNIVIQVSVDSYVPEDHDKFRNHSGAFKKAMKTFDLLKELDIQSSLRSSITPDRINQIEGLIKLAKDKGAMRVGIGSVIPVGKGKENEKLRMSPKDKKIFLEKLVECKEKYPELDITTEDPQKFALDNCPWDYGEYDIEDETFFGGCSAGISGFNIDSVGILTPCAVLLKEILDLKNLSIGEAKEKYVNSQIIKKLFERKFSGKCGKCKLKKLCGGCRAVAEGINGDYLGEDITCFYDGK